MKNRKRKQNAPKNKSIKGEEKRRKKRERKKNGNNMCTPFMSEPASYAKYVYTHISMDICEANIIPVLG